MGDAPTYQPPPTDPTVAALNAQAATADQTALQNQAQMDTASIMSRYGTRLAIAGTTTGGSAPGAPLAVTPPPVAVR